MKKSYLTPSLRYCLALIIAAMVAGVPSMGAAQFIDAGTPTATAEPGSGGDWGSLLPGGGGSESAEATPAVAGDVFVLPGSGVEIVVGPGVTTDTTPDTEVPDQIIVETDAGLGALAVLDAVGSPLGILERYVGGFGETMDSVVQVEAQSSPDLATGVYRVETEGLTVYMFISVDADTIDGFMVIEVVVAGSADMEDSLLQIRENVTINGVPAFANVNEQDIVEIIARDEG